MMLSQGEENKTDDGGRTIDLTRPDQGDVLALH
jgi:hypothetical protein